jgi:hypothetical protein
MLETSPITTRCSQRSLRSSRRTKDQGPGTKTPWSHPTYLTYLTYLTHQAYLTHRPWFWDMMHI